MNVTVNAAISAAIGNAKRLSPAKLLLLFLATLSVVIPAQAQESDPLEVFVYGINATIPDAVIGTFAPPTVEEIYLLSDRTSILSPRRTEVYYWAITNEYRASWSKLNETVEGSLEVLQRGQVVATFEQTSYTIHFSSGAGGDKPQLYTGQEAITADEAFQSAQLAYQQATYGYQSAREQWLAAAREAQARGDDPATLAPAPEPPEPFNVYSTGLNRGFPIYLEDGTYQIQTRRPDGDVIPESVRRLIVFSPRRTAVGYEVIPETRWTFPERLNDLADAILGESGSVLYLKPYIVREYPSLAYDRLEDPQFKGDTSGSEWKWVSGEPLEESVLEIVQNDEVIERIALESYFAKQVPGKDLGYEILRYDASTPTLTPRVDFQGYRLALSAERATVDVRMRSLDNEHYVGSSREVRVVRPVPLLVLLLVPLPPLALGAALLYARRRRTRLNRLSTISD
jgi:hypothetical protein